MKTYAEQIAALPIRKGRDGKVKVLMVTSRGSRRWIMPKGWRMEGKTPWAAARIEALEEAGAKGQVSHRALGEYRYKKTLPGGKKVRCRVRVYPMLVEKLTSNWKERSERKRKWVSPKRAAKRVSDPELAELLRAIGKKPKHKAALRNLL